jgi:hypothetical protein
VYLKDISRDWDVLSRAQQLDDAAIPELAFKISPMVVAQIRRENKLFHMITLDLLQKSDLGN